MTPEEAKKRIAVRVQVNKTFASFFEAIGYAVTFEGLSHIGGDRWHEIYDDDGVIVQVAFGTPLEEFLADLPHLAEGKSGIGPTEYWCACEDDDKLRALHARVTDVWARRLSCDELAEALVGQRVKLAHQVYSSSNSEVYEVGTQAKVRAVSDGGVFQLVMADGHECLLNRGMFEVMP